MKKDEITKYNQMDAKSLVMDKAKKQEELVRQKAELAQSGKKSSIQTKKLKREIARIETSLSEKLSEKI